MFLVVETLFSSRKKTKTMSLPCIRVIKNSDFYKKKKVFPCEIACGDFLRFWSKNEFAMYTLSLKREIFENYKFSQSNFPLTAFDGIRNHCRSTALSSRTIWPRNQTQSNQIHIHPFRTRTQSDIGIFTIASALHATVQMKEA